MNAITPADPTSATNTTTAAQPGLILTVNALCGAGKSHASIEEVAAGIMRGERYLIAGPTAKQSSQYVEDLQAALLKLGGPAASLRASAVNAETVRGLAGDDHDPTVAQRVAQEIKDTPARTGRAICITHATLHMMRRKAVPANWHLIIDETNACVVPEQLTMPAAYFMGLRFQANGHGRHQLVAASNGALHQAVCLAREERIRMRREAQAARRDGRAGDATRLDDEATDYYHKVETALRDLLQKVESGNWSVFAMRQDLQQTDEGDELALRLPSSGGVKQVVLTSVLNWDTLLGLHRPRWESVTIMAANLDRSFAGLTLKEQGFTLVPHPTITPRLRYCSQHPNGSRLTIYYGSSRAMSKRLRNTNVAGTTFGKLIFADVEKLFTGQNYAWSANKDILDTALTGTRMPFVSHGLNEFMAFRHVAVMNISNLNPQCLEAIGELGFSTAEVRRALMVENVYQAVLRSAFRDPNDPSSVCVVVPDRECADFIESVAPGSKVLPLGCDEPEAKKAGRRAIHANDAARSATNKAIQRQDQRDWLEVCAERFREKVLNAVVGPPDYTYGLYAAKNAPEPFATGRFASFDDFAAELHAWFGRPAIAQKEANSLILDAALQASDEVNERGQPKMRGNANIASRSILWFDIESLKDGASGIPISPDQFRTIFPDLRMILYSSFQHEANDPAKTRYRVAIPLSHAVAPDAYRALFDLVLKRLERHRWFNWFTHRGQKVRFHGVDWSKRAPCSLFYIPAVSAAAPADAWIRDEPGEFLAIEDWLRGDLSAIIPAAEVIDLPPASASLSAADLALAEDMADAAVATYLGLPRGTQNDELNRLAWRLAGYGLDYAAIEVRIRRAAASSHSSQDRQADVPRVMRNLRRNRPANSWSPPG